jgi:hypothetical protein
LCPRRIRLTTMPLPMFPVPMNPMSIGGSNFTESNVAVF